jgi:hypothetical protein
MIIIELDDGRTVKYIETAYVYRYRPELIGDVLNHHIPALDIRPGDKIGPPADIAGVVRRMTFE